MQLTSRLSVSLIFGVAVVSLAFAFYQTRAQSLGMQRDLERQALAVGDSLERTAETLVAEHSYDQLQRLMERFKDRATVTGVAAYDAAGRPLAATTRAGGAAGRHAGIGFAGDAKRMGERGIADRGGMADARDDACATERRDGHRGAFHRAGRGVYRDADGGFVAARAAGEWRCRRW